MGKVTRKAGNTFEKNLRDAKTILLFDSRIGCGKGKCRPPQVAQAANVIETANLTLSEIILTIYNLTNRMTAKLFVLCHGLPGFLQLSNENLNKTNVKQFELLKDRLTSVEIFACLAGNPGAINIDKNGVTYDWYVFKDMADYLNAPVKIAKEKQHYVFDEKTLQITLLPWDGPIFTIHPGGVANEGGSGAIVTK